MLLAAESMAETMTIIDCCRHHHLTHEVMTIAEVAANDMLASNCCSSFMVQVVLRLRCNLEAPCKLFAHYCAYYLRLFVNLILLSSMFVISSGSSDEAFHSEQAFE